MTENNITEEKEGEALFLPGQLIVSHVPTGTSSHTLLKKSDFLNLPIREDILEGEEDGENKRRKAAIIWMYHIA